MIKKDMERHLLMKKAILQILRGEKVSNSISTLASILVSLLLKYGSRDESLAIIDQMRKDFLIRSKE